MDTREELAARSRPGPPRALAGALAVALALVPLLAAAPGCFAQDTPPARLDVAERVEVERTDIETRLAELEDAAFLAEETRGEIRSVYTSALERLGLAEQWEARRADFARRLEESPARLQQIQEAFDALPPTPEAPVVPPGLGVDELDQRAKQADAERAAAQAEVERLDAERDGRAVRRTEVPVAAAEAEARLIALRQELATATGQPTPADPVEAERSRAAVRLLKARELSRQAELAALQEEIQSYDELREVNAAERELAARRLARAVLAVTTWREAATAAEAAEAERVAAEARRRAEQEAEAEVADLAATNADLAGSRTGPTGLLAQIEDARRRLASVQAVLQELNEDFASVQTKYQRAGQTTTIGTLMVRERGDLPDVRQYERRAREREQETAQVQLRSIETEERLEDLERELEQRVAERVAQLGPDRPEAEVRRIEAAARRLLEDRRDLLADLERDYETYVDVLVELETESNRLMARTREFAEFIDERVLWVRLLQPLHGDPDLADNTAEAVTWLLDPVAWARMAAGAGQVAARERPLRTGITALLVLMLFLMKPVLRRRIHAAAEDVRRLRTDRFALTLRTLLDTVLLAMPLPLALWVFGALVRDGDRGNWTTEQALSVGAALQATALFWGGLAATAQVARPGGLADAHFRYPSDSLKRLRARLRLLLVLGLPLLFVDEACRTVGSESLRRMAFIGGQFVLVWFLLSLLRVPKGVIAPHVERHPEGWIARTRWLWLLLAVGLPLTLTTLVALGYVYTADQLRERVRATIVIVLGLSLVYGLILRSLFVVRRRLALEVYLRRRAAAAEHEDGEVVDEEDEIDVDEVSDQSRRLVTTLTVVLFVAGCWVIWVDVLPALKVLDDVELWSHTEDVVDREVDPVSGAERVVVVPQQVPVTLVDGLLALVWVLLTVVAARNAPGLLEIAVLQRLPIQRAGRYATTTVMRYLIVIGGLGGAFGVIGIGWAKVQWLAAAVTVGLGFGLQEIFANFVSGLIMLFERPVRVGDTVTVGTVTGQVTRIRMRATTIMSWDETELVVPNKEFITQQLVNWTLSNSTLRVVARVGIAYGSDTELATRLLYQVAREQSEVMDEPPPRVVFKEFGDSTLNFELRCYVDTPERFRTIHHQLNTGIDQAFRKAGIEIAFPQRDLHLRSSDISLRLERARPSAGVEPAPGGNDS